MPNASGAYENMLLSTTFHLSSNYNTVSGALSQFTFVKLSDADFHVCQATGSTQSAAPIGILQQSGKKNEGVAVGMIGISKLRLAGTVTRGQFVAATAAGEGIRHFGLGVPAARALSSGVDNDVIPVLLLTSCFSTKG